MRRYLYILPVLLFCFVLAEGKNNYRFTSAELKGKTKKEFIDGLLGRMTVEEKIGQLNLPGYGNVEPDAKKSDIASRIRRGEVGGIFNINGLKSIRALQEVAVKESRLGIPIIIGADVCSGYKTGFPIPMGMACSFKPENVEKAARISSEEATTGGVCWTYSPMVDISRDARWGRSREGAGEDPFLGSDMAKAWVRGYQGDDLSANNTMMACVKHFALYGAAESGRDYNPVDMSRVTAMNYYLEPYKASIEAGVGSVMTSFNEFESVPATGHSWLLKDILRDAWGFEGFVVSDYTAILEMVNHGVGDKEAVSLQALKCGVDMDMIADFYSSSLIGLYKSGKVTEAEIDNACRRILEAKFDLGLFHNPYQYCDEERGEKVIFSEANLREARRIATESYVLLKNDGDVLPLKTAKKIAVVGPLADTKANMCGSWIDVKTNQPYGLVEELQNRYNGVEVVYSRGANLADDEKIEFNFTDNKNNVRKLQDLMIKDAEKVVEGADAIIVALGESASMSGEGASRAVLELPETQMDLLRKMKATGKPVIVVLFTGRPLALQNAEPYADAILNVWMGGTDAAGAIVDVLSGAVNPTAKLTMTFPRVTGQCPIYYNHKNTGRPMAPDAWFTRYVSNYIDVVNEPLYPFGYGLSYSKYEYGDITLDKNEINEGGAVTASVKVTNVSDVDGEEIVQLYIHDKIRSITPPVKELKGYRRVALKAGESKIVQFTIDSQLLKFYNSELQFVAEPGEFEVMIGGSSDSVKKAVFTLK